MQNKIINTRVTADLYDKISKMAKKHSTSMSSLIRDMIKDTFEIYGDVSTIIDKKIREKLGSKKRILGYQDLILSKPMKCTACNSKIDKGKKAFMAILENAKGSSIIICQKCFKSI